MMRKLVSAFLTIIILFSAINSFGTVLKSGMYGYDLELVVTGNEVYGFYHYYDGYIPQCHCFGVDTTLYIYGHIKNEDTIFVNVGFPHGIIFSLSYGDYDAYIIPHGNNSLTSFLPEYTRDRSHEDVSSYEDSDAENLDNDYGDKYVGLGIIKCMKGTKCFLYSDTLEQLITKAYLIEDNLVRIIKRAGDWTEIEYESKNTSHKPIVKWIKSKSLYDKDPAKW